MKITQIQPEKKHINICSIIIGNAVCIRAKRIENRSNRQKRVYEVIKKFESEIPKNFNLFLKFVLKRPNEFQPK